MLNTFSVSSLQLTDVRRPEEMRPFFAQAQESAGTQASPSITGPTATTEDPGKAGSSVGAAADGDAPAPQQLYDTLVQLGLLRR